MHVPIGARRDPTCARRRRSGSPSPSKMCARSCAPNSRAALRCDRVEYRLHIGRRTADDPQDLARRRLLLERLLRLVEQAHVLDRDHRLVGEGCRERDLLFGKRPGNRACQDQNTDWGAFAEQRNADHGAISTRRPGHRCPLYSGSAFASRMWTVLPSSKARPTQVALPGLLTTCLSAALCSGDCPNIAATLNPSPSGRQMFAPSASHNLHARFVDRIKHLLQIERPTG